jgi:tetratricopeptide (TPR) repeat protein
LRRRGQLESAYKVARGGLSRYPALADAHDLMARILGDQGDLAGAFDAWAEALRFDPMRIGALKGIAFLYFRAGDVPAALEHLQRAADIDPDDESIRQAIERVRSPARPATPSSDTAASVEGEAISDGEVPVTVLSARAPASRPAAASANGHGQNGVLLVDGKGLRLNGSLRGPNNEEVGDRVAAELAGVSKEAARTTKLLGLGGWSAIAVEAPDGNLFLVAPTPDTLLLTVRESSLPMARLGLIAERAAKDARDWLGQQQ